MFKLSRGGEYAIRGIIYIASMKPGIIVQIKEIEKARNISGYFLVKVFSKLSNSGILQSVRGSRGGFRLAKPLNKISVLDIITAIEGPVNYNDCFICDNAGKCKMKGVWEEVKNKMIKVLESKKLSDIV